MYSHRPLGRVLVLLAVVATLLTGCGVVDSISGGESVVRVYSGRHYDLEEAFETFAAETDISVEFLYGGDSELRERLQTEGDYLRDLAEYWRTGYDWRVHKARSTSSPSSSPPSTARTCTSSTRVHPSQIPFH